MSRFAPQWSSAYRPAFSGVVLFALGGLACLLCGLMAALLVVLMDRDIGGLFPTPQPTPTVASIDPTWDHIVARRKIIVGVSADNPPFASIGPDFSLQGYDIALAREIGRRMNLSVEFSNMAFDGLLDAIRLGQIDAAVASLAATPERQAVVSFTSMYYAGADAVLANRSAPVAISQVQDLARYRVGVQKGSVYSGWLYTTLVQPGIMPPQNLVTFPTVGDAVSALVGPAQSVNLVVMDRIPAQAATQSRPLVIVANGLYPQAYAVAIPKQAPTFQALLNLVIAQMQADGTLGRLAQQYLNITAQPVPTPTPTLAAPTPLPPTPPAACLDGMAFVGDINYPDDNMQNPARVPAGAPIQKGWRIRNTGTCTWNANYVLVYSGSNPVNSPVGGNPVAVQGVVLPGQAYDVYAGLMTPARSGVYQSFWSLRNPKGENFGNRLWAGIQVVSAATPTAGPLTPVIYGFTSTPLQIQQGQCITLQWNFSGQNLTLTRLFRFNEVIFQDLPANGSRVDCPGITGAVEYRLVLDSQTGGSTAAAVVVNVAPIWQPTATPRPTQAPAPVIQYFRADQNQIVQGGCVNLSWAFNSQGFNTGEIFRNDVSIAKNRPSSGTLQDCPTAWGQTVYRLQVGSWFTGTSASATVFVYVLQFFP